MAIVTPAVAPRRVLVVHADPVQRRLFVRGLGDRGVAVVVEAGSVGEARSVARSPGARDLAVVGVADAEGWALVAELCRVGWTPVVLLATAVDVPLVRDALTQGVTGVLFPASARSAPAAVRASASAVRPGPRPVPDVRGVPQLLTGRELQILQFAADGMPNSDIAEQLGISPLTIKSHLGRIARRLGSGERARMVLLALRAGAIG